MTAPLTVRWRPRAEPLSPVAVAAFGEAAHALVRRCLARDDEALTRLRGVHTVGTTIAGVLLTGETGDLPWTDGALYLGRDGEAPLLLLPTALEPDVPLALYQNALRRHLGAAPVATGTDASPPLAVFPAQGLVLSAAGARPLDRAQLQAWLTGKAEPETTKPDEAPPAASVPALPAPPEAVP